MSTTTAIDKITKCANRVRTGNHKIKPGQPRRMSEAAGVSNGISDAERQGDLYLAVITSIPNGYVRVKSLKDIDRQLVPGNTEGARHCLDSLDGVELYRPDNWPDSGLNGPCIVLTKERTVEHPTHGHVTIPAGMTILCMYQREWDVEQKQERRNAD